MLRLRLESLVEQLGAATSQKAKQLAYGPSGANALLVLAQLNRAATTRHLSHQALQAVMVPMQACDLSCRPYASDRFLLRYFKGQVSMLASCTHHSCRARWEDAALVAAG